MENASDTATPIYLDYAAATPVDASVLEAMLPYFSDCFYNPSAPYALARKAKADLEAARATLARSIGAKPANLVLTAGATEANNLALCCVEGEVAVSAIEHESVLATARARKHRIIATASDGRISPEMLAEAITPDTELVSIALANGEVGAIQPMRKLADVVAKERARRLEAGLRRPLWLHTDASQALATSSVNVSSLGVDLLTASAAKVYGPKQVGFLWARDGIALRPLVRGGGQERGVRSGTENVAGAVGFARAVELAADGREAEARRLQELRNGLQRRLLTAFPSAVVSGPKKDRHRLPGLLHVSFPGIEARRLVILLEERGVCVGTGSACAASRMKTSHVLAALGVPDDVAAGSLRITLGRPTTAEEVERAAEAIIEVVREEAQRCGVRL